jgi:hypothetical protein
VPDEKHPTDHLLDLFVYGPLGFVLEADEVVPKLVERGRATVGSQMGTARFIGQVVVGQGRKELDRQLARLRTAVPCWPGSGGAPGEATAAQAPPAATPAPPPSAPGAAAAGAPVTVPSDVEDAVAEEREVVLDDAGLHEPARPDDSDLAIPGYDSLAASQVVPRLAGLSAAELEAVRRYEAAHRGRRTILTRIGQLQAGR